MSYSIEWIAKVSVKNGPTFTISESAPVDAYCVVSLTVPQGDTRKCKLQPESETARIALLLISSSPCNDKLTCTAGGKSFALDRPQLYASSGMMSLFASAPTEIEVKNDSSVPVTVTALVGRTAA